MLGSWTVMKKDAAALGLKFFLRSSPGPPLSPSLVVFCYLSCSVSIFTESLRSRHRQAGSSLSCVTPICHSKATPSSKPMPCPSLSWYLSAFFPPCFNHISFTCKKKKKKNRSSFHYNNKYSSQLEHCLVSFGLRLLISVRLASRQRNCGKRGRLR